MTNPALSRLSVGAISPPPRQTLGELVYADLRASILSTKLLPGTPISENELAALTGTSRTPIREAIRRLAEERLVEVTPQQGTIVSRIDTVRARQAIFVRQTIECGVLERKGRLDEKELAILEGEVRRHVDAIAAHDTLASAELDEAFHARLMLCCDCPEATTAIRAISGDIARILFLSGSDEHYYSSVANDHMRLIELMREERYSEAVDMLRRHIGGFAVDQQELRGKSADFFTGE